MATLRRGTKAHKAVLSSASGCVVYSQHNQYKGKKVSPEAAFTALEKFSFAKLVECDGRYIVRVHERCWFELVHGEELPSEDDFKFRAVKAGAGRKVHLGHAGSSGSFCGHYPVRIVGEDLSTVTCKKCRANFPALFNRLEQAPAAIKCRRCGGEVTTAGEGNLRYTGCEVCGEEHITEDEGYNCSHCDTDNLAGATHCACCKATRGSHPNDREYDFNL